MLKFDFYELLIKLKSIFHDLNDYVISNQRNFVNGHTKGRFTILQ